MNSGDGYSDAPKEKLGLLDALRHYNEPTISSAEKQFNRDLALEDRPLTEDEMMRLMAYNVGDARDTARLARHIIRDPRFSLPHALLRGKAMWAHSEMEWVGVPVDREMESRLRSYHDDILSAITSKADLRHEVFNPDGSFGYERFAGYLARNGITDWPMTRTGLPKTDDEVVQEMVRRRPQLRPVLSALSFTRSFSSVSKPLEIGQDGRARGLLSPFATKTSRNRLRPTVYPLARAAWQKSLLVGPARGEALSYVDFSGQELAISAVLSGDTTMIRDYLDADMHMNFAVAVGLAPAGATKSTHPNERAVAKSANFAILYGVKAIGLARTLGKSIPFAQELLYVHSRRYPNFWAWRNDILRRAFGNRAFNGISGISTLFGWQMLVTKSTRPNTVKNFPSQANAAEMTRLAAMFAIDGGVQVCGPHRDALLVVAPQAEIKAATMATRAAMARASRLVLKGFEIRTDVETVCYPDKLVDPRGDAILKVIKPILDRVTQEQAAGGVECANTVGL